MRTFLENNLEKFIRINADCIPVKGAMRSAIYDLTRNDLTFFPSDYYYILSNLEGKNGEKILALIDSLSDEDEAGAYFQLINFLFESEFAIMTSFPERFPKIQSDWEIPCVINDAIIDIDTVIHDMDRIFDQLDQLGCQYLQIRSFSTTLTFDELESILKKVMNRSIQGVELILKFDREISQDKYKSLLIENPIVSSMIIHSSHQDEEVIVDFEVEEEIKPFVKKKVQFFKAIINSEAHCGVISLSNLSTPDVPSFFENLSFNGCLNRKIAVDKNGNIKNCPSMNEAFGNINYDSLEQALSNSAFTEKWLINKDQINICKDCELRYICSDCRAYTQEANSGEYPKPIKCTYNPYTADWENV
jgi:SPASM domain peptide maturase of grasp-with-spasm system